LESPKLPNTLSLNTVAFCHPRINLVVLRFGLHADLPQHLKPLFEPLPVLCRAGVDAEYRLDYACYRQNQCSNLGNQRALAKQAKERSGPTDDGYHGEYRATQL